jgi:DNA-binding FadR family transcriptional regulator
MLLIRGGVESDFLRYLLLNAGSPGGRLPSLSEISAETGVSVGKLREQLQVARMLGLVEISPRRGIRLVPYNFLPAVRLSLMVALSLDRDAFYQYSAVRVHLETAFWDEAVSRLTEADKAHLLDLVESAQFKLGQRSTGAVPVRSAGAVPVCSDGTFGVMDGGAGPVERIQIPHQEHRAFHLTIYSRLNNLFVLGLLEAYWDAYEAVELSTYADYSYLREVWSYHARIAEAITRGEYGLGKELLMAHVALIDTRGNTHEFPGAGTRSHVPGRGAGVARNASALAASEAVGAPKSS